MVRELYMPIPINTFVKIPNSGVEKEATPSLCDLSFVANIRPANPLPASVATVNNQKLLNKKTTQPIESMNSRIQNGQMKRHLEDNVNSFENNAKRQKIINVQKLLFERKNLIQTNRELNQKINIFKNLLKDRRKLNQVLAKIDQAQKEKNLVSTTA